MFFVEISYSTTLVNPRWNKGDPCFSHIAVLSDFEFDLERTSAVD